MTEKKISPRFEYRISILKEGGVVKTLSFNSPYEDLTKARDDIEVMLKGTDLRGADVPGGKVLSLEDRDDGVYWARVLVRYLPNGDDTYSQVFQLLDLVQGERRVDPFVSTGEGKK